jgi:hypothetical protein
MVEIKSQQTLFTTPTKGLSIALMTHKSRSNRIKYYKDLLGNALIIQEDDGSKGLIGNCRASWACYDKRANYHLVLQDDLLLTTDFLQKVFKYLESGDDVYHFYLRNTPRVRNIALQALKDGKDRIHLNNVYSGQAICFKTDLILELLEAYDNHDSGVDDQRINSFVRNYKLKVCFPLPCLVEHLNLESLHSFNKSPMDSRVAVVFKP